MKRDKGSNAYRYIVFSFELSSLHVSMLMPFYNNVKYCLVFSWVDKSSLSFDLWAPGYPIEGALSPSINTDACVAGPCSASFGLCDISCTRKLSYICEARKVENSATPIPVKIQETTPTPSTTSSSIGEIPMPSSMSMMGRLIMTLARMMLPERAMGWISQMMYSVPRTIYAGMLIPPRASSVFSIFHFHYTALWLQS